MIDLRTVNRLALHVLDDTFDHPSRLGGDRQRHRKREERSAYHHPRKPAVESADHGLLLKENDSAVVYLFLFRLRRAGGRGPHRARRQADQLKQAVASCKATADRRLAPDDFRCPAMAHRGALCQASYCSVRPLASKWMGVSGKKRRRCATGRGRLAPAATTRRTVDHMPSCAAADPAPPAHRGRGGDG